MDFVLGFVFDNTKENVLLIKKQKPDWQKGRLNGIGGKIENNETPYVAMARECLEETGLSIISWRHYATLTFSSEDKVFVFSSIGDISNVLDEGRGESLHKINVKDIITNNISVPIMTNLPWLITMSQDKGFGNILTIDYNEPNSIQNKIRI